MHQGAGAAHQQQQQQPPPPPPQSQRPLQDCWQSPEQLVQPQQQTNLFIPTTYPSPDIAHARIACYSEDIQNTTTQQTMHQIDQPTSTSMPVQYFPSSSTIVTSLNFPPIVAPSSSSQYFPVPESFQFQTRSFQEMQQHPDFHHMQQQQQHQPATSLLTNVEVETQQSGGATSLTAGMQMAGHLLNATTSSFQSSMPSQPHQQHQQQQQQQQHHQQGHAIHQHNLTHAALISSNQSAASSSISLFPHHQQQQQQQQQHPHYHYQPQHPFQQQPPPPSFHPLQSTSTTSFTVPSSSDSFLSHLNSNQASHSLPTTRPLVHPSISSIRFPSPPNSPSIQTPQYHPVSLQMGFLQPVDPQDPVQPLNQLNMSTGSNHSQLNLTEPHRTPSGTLMDALQDPYPQRFQSDFTHRRHVSLDESSRPSNPASLWQPSYIDRPASVPVLDTPTGSTENLTINTSFEPSDPPKPLGRYICSTCQTRFTRRSALEKHSLTHTTPTYASSHSPPSTTSTSSTSLTTTPSGKKLCPHCPTSFLRPHDLHRHIRTKHTSDRPFKCPNCPASFSRGDSLRKHLECEKRGTAKGPYSVTTLRLRAVKEAEERAAAEARQQSQSGSGEE